MSFKTYPLRYAHSEGHTDVCYTENGRQMITCGIDGDIRIWAGIEDTDPESYCVGEGAFGVAQKGDDIYVGRDDGRVIIVKFPEGERSGFLTRFTAAATHIAVAKNESLIACVSEDFSVKVFKNAQDVDVQLSDLKGPALGVTISDDGIMLAVSSGDGKINIWNVEEKKLLKSIDCIPKCNSFTSAKILGRGSFNSKGKYFAYPHNKEIVIADIANNFEKVFSLKSDQVESPFSIAQFSPCDNYIAASSTNGEICIWRCLAGSEAIVQPHEQKYSICALAWNPLEKGEIAFCDVSGQVGTIDYLPSEADDLQFEANDVVVPELAAIDMSDEDNENVISLEALKNDTMGDFRPISPSNVSSRSASRAQSPERSRSPPCTLQPPFQPSSTPHHLTQRFMVFNEIGVVKLHNDDDGTSSIDVQFHEAAFFKNLYMKNNLNHTMASLSTGVLALACEVPSKLVCIPLKPGIKEWTSDMTDLEEILCIASSSSLVALATNIRMFRIFSVFGLQRAVISIPGPAICAAAYKDYACVIYHACTAHSKDQNLSAMLVHINGTNVTSKYFPIPITPQTTLSWIGFTDAGSLASYDSAGMLRICKLQSEAWIPACDTAVHIKGASSSYFMVHVSEKSQTLRVIHCKGAMYPAVTPLPLLNELPMQVPMCEVETDKTQMEDKLFRWCFFEAEYPEKLFKEMALKLFALACKNNLDDRAFEILMVLDNPQLVLTALKYANKLNKQRLTMKITEYLAKLQGEQITSKTETTANKTIRPIPTRKPRPPDRSVPGPSNLSEPVYQPEIFTPDLTASNTTLNESQLNDVTFISKTKKNPFVKTVSTENKRNPFSLTNPANTSLDSTFGPIQAQSKKSENENQNKPIEKDSFTTWYNQQKPSLEKEHPHVSATDLVKLALKMYKSQAEKRKASDDIDKEAQKPKQAKLQSFAFVKR